MTHAVVQDRGSLSRGLVEDARQRLGGRVIRTPVVRSAGLDRRAGARLWLKAENLQRGGSFKLRGALLAVDRIVAGGASGVIAHSTGNHAVAVALAAQECGIPAELVLSRDVAPEKVRLIRRAGAAVAFAGATMAERIALLRARQGATGYHVVDPYQDLDVVLGQATASAELLEQVGSAGGSPDALIVPVGGGSALAGACLAASGSGTAVIAAEPAAVDALTQALRAGCPVTVPARPTIADGLRPDRIGQLPFDLCRFAVDSVLLVEEAAMAEAMDLALTHTRMLIEPAAAAALAAALSLAREPRWAGCDLGVLVTGGNIDVATTAQILGRPVMIAGPA